MCFLWRCSKNLCVCLCVCVLVYCWVEAVCLIITCSVVINKKRFNLESLVCSQFNMYHIKLKIQWCLSKY